MFSGEQQTQKQPDNKTSVGQEETNHCYREVRGVKPLPSFPSGLFEPRESTNLNFHSHAVAGIVIFPLSAAMIQVDSISTWLVWIHSSTAREERHLPPLAAKAPYRILSHRWEQSSRMCRSFHEITQSIAAGRQYAGTSRTGPFCLVSLSQSLCQNLVVRSPKRGRRTRDCFMLKVSLTASR